jgi:hypothetical protein
MRFKKRRSTRRTGGFFKRRSRHAGTSGLNPIKLMIGAAIYGIFRNKISDLVAPLTAKVPLGSFADEAVLGVAGYFAAKKGKGMVKDIGTAALTIESYRVGEIATTGMFKSTAANSSALNGWQ